MWKIFPLVPSKKPLFTFQFLSDEIYSYIKNSHFVPWQFGKIDILVNFITQKLKSKHLAISVFSGQSFFWGNEKKYFPHIPGLDHGIKQPNLNFPYSQFIILFSRKSMYSLCLHLVWITCSLPNFLSNWNLPRKWIEKNTIKVINIEIYSWEFRIGKTMLWTSHTTILRLEEKKSILTPYIFRVLE